MSELINTNHSFNKIDNFYSIRIKDGLLFPDELKNIRLKFSLNYERADSIFGLKYGSYELYETGVKLHTVVEDIAIRGTNLLDSNGFNILLAYT